MSVGELTRSGREESEGREGITLLHGLGVRVGLLGFGRIGQAVASLIAGGSSQLAPAGIVLHAVAALVRDRAKTRHAPVVELLDNSEEFFRGRLDVVVEVMGGVHPAYEYVKRALESGLPVVTANKTLMAEKGAELREIARRRDVALAYDAAVLAGVPFLGALSKRPFVAAPKRITGILNGTSHYLTSALSNGGSFASALTQAIAAGYAEPDSAADVTGRDAAEKLTILSHLAGCRDLETKDLTRVSLEVLTPTDFAAARALAGVIKPIATAIFDPETAGAWVGPAFVDGRHGCAASAGVFNFVEYDSGALPITFSGPGAGPAVTAATILDDVAEIVATRSGRESFSEGVVTRRPPRVSAALRQPAPGQWYLRVANVGSLRIEDLAEHLAAHHIPALQIVAVDGSIAARTVRGSWGSISALAAELKAIGADVLVLPVIEARDE